MTTFVSVEETEQDFPTRAESRTLLQFRKSPVFMDVLQGMIAELVALQTAIINVINLRGPKDATGENLNVIGRIVGQDRLILDYTSITWFAPDSYGIAPDQGLVWVDGAPIAGSYLVDDGWYRELIQARISRNFSQYGSVPEIQTVIKQALGVDVSFYRTGMMQARMIVSAYTPVWVLNFLLRIYTNYFVDDILFSPFPATLDINSLLYFFPGESFAPDTVNGPDVGFVAVSQDISFGDVLQGSAIAFDEEISGTFLGDAHGKILTTIDGKYLTP